MATLQKRTQISIITVNYGNDELTLSFIKHLGTNDSIEIIVVDNSEKNTLQQKLPSHVLYIHAGKNRGYGGAVNLGIKQCKGEWIMVLNNDIETSSTDVLNLAKITSEQKALLATPKLGLQDNTIQHSVGYFDSFFTHPVNYIFARPRFINPSQITDNTTVDLTTGAAMLIHKKIIDQIGSFDDKNFFMYFEDIDLCMRTNKKGLKWLFIPQVQMKHLQSISANKDTTQKKKNYQGSAFTYLVKNRGTFIALIHKLIPVY